MVRNSWVFPAGRLSRAGSGTCRNLRDPAVADDSLFRHHGLRHQHRRLPIIKSVGMDMVRLEKYQGFAADTAAALCLLFSSLTGFRLSTTHTKTTAIMGVGAARRLSNVNWGVVREMVMTWILTFPGCGLISFLMAKLFFILF